MSKSIRVPKPKKVKYQLIHRQGAPGEPMYQMLDELIRQNHSDLFEARIAIAWCTSSKPDVDGRTKIGQLKKASDLDRELMPYDYVVLLNRDFWENELVKNEQRRALLDHELCHGALKLDKHGEPITDDRNRKVYRLRKHDIEEFTQIIERHGCYKREIEDFAAALRKAKQGTLDFASPGKSQPAGSNGADAAEQPSA